ncbi:hypothetical protein [Ruminococcus flavefaciens]|uniref:hypothetical protein n=1 Tax=Ruminococcus flavefaciens TaxID=1265 RepID=UPI0004903349|nr:hypothetical protein [Ruminococcus flavefaciens]
MKKIVKKISAIAMAFTILGTGTAITKYVSPKSDNTLIAHAECRNCHNILTCWFTYTTKTGSGNSYLYTVHCGSCRRALYSYWWFS